MIISFPTALYQSVIPVEPEDSGNITFTISSTNPPRSTETFFQLLRSVELRRLPDRIYTQEQRRARYGDLIFHLADSTQKKVASGKKIYEVGQLLDFEDIQEPSNVSTLNVPSTLELQQNTNILELESLGLSKDEIDTLISGATQKLDSAITSLNDTKTAISDKEAEIADNQRLINEARKAREAAQAVFSDSTSPTAGNDIISKLVDKEAQLQAQRAEFIDELNALTAEANEIYNEILDLREVVR